MDTPPVTPPTAQRPKPKHWSFYAFLWFGVLIGSIALGVVIVALLATFAAPRMP